MEKNILEEDDTIVEVIPKNGFGFKVNLFKANNVRLAYIAISFLLMFSSIYKISLMGITESINIMDYAFSGLNFGTLYFIVLVLATAVEVLVSLQDNKFVKNCKKMLALLLPISLFVLTFIFIYTGFDIRSQAMETGTVSIFLFVGLVIHAVYFMYIKFPYRFKYVVKKIKSIKK